MFSEPGSPKRNVKFDAPARGPAAAIPSNAALPKRSYCARFSASDRMS